MARAVAIWLLALGMLVSAHGSDTLNAASVFLPQEVPDTILFCGMKLIPDEDARKAIATDVNRLLESPRIFNQMVQRARIYLPFVVEGLADMGVPEDMKYLVIQESRLDANAVSSSNAVGYWQFKQETAIECGLMVSNEIDERRHIYRASRAAGFYLSRGFMQYNNWLYAALAFKEGPTGSQIYTEPQYYNARAMPLTKSTHWYALRALAHKIAYEPALGTDDLPEVLLSPIPSNGVTNVKRLYESHSLTADRFFEFNNWIVNRKSLPKDQEFTYYVPQVSFERVWYPNDPTKNLGRPPKRVLHEHLTVSTPPQQPDWQKEPPKLPVPQPDTSAWAAPGEPPRKSDNRPAQPVAQAFVFPSARDPEILPQAAYADFQIDQDLHHGREFIWFTGEKPFHQIALARGLSLANLREWNNLREGELPPAGSVIYLKKPSRVAFHIVKPGENLGDIAAFHNKPVNKIRRNNYIPRANPVIYTGQKLYLQKRKPKNERMIILNPPDGQQAADQKAGAQPKVLTPPLPGGQGTQAEPQWQFHTVQPGETLWRISQRYQVRVEQIKLDNNLSGDAISIGQRLKIRPNNP